MFSGDVFKNGSHYRVGEVEKEILIRLMTDCLGMRRLGSGSVVGIVDCECA